MRIKKAFRWAGILVLTMASASCAASPDVLPGVLESSWGKLSDTLTEVLRLEDKKESLPDSKWIGEDKTSNAKKIDALLDQALSLLLQGDANDLRKEAIALRERIPALRGERDALRNKRISAPDASSASWSAKLPWIQSRQDIDKRIEELTKEIESKEKALVELNARIASELRQLGLDLDDGQVDILLTSVTGDDLFQNAVIFSNVRRVVEKLAELAREDRDNLEANRRYTGMYLVLNDLLIYTQEGLVEKIDRDFRPRLTEIQNEAQKLRTDALTKAKQSVYTDAQKKSFEANAESNGLTVRVAGLYMELLASQRKSVNASLADLRRNRDVAESTYRTVRSSGDLRNLIRSGLDLFDSIQALSMPEIQTFQNDTIRKEFEEINRRLAK
jgi:cell division septum initiation protein DivIVA